MPIRRAVSSVIAPGEARCHRVVGLAAPVPRPAPVMIATVPPPEVIGDQRTLFPDNEATLEAAKLLVKEGFTVLPYCIDDPIVCR